MDNKNSVDLEKLINSLKVVEVANDNLNNMSLSNIIMDIDNDLTKLNFEHGNCFKDYKEILDSLINELDTLKVETNELVKSLGKTINNFSNIENSISFRKTDLLNSLGGAVENNNVTKIPEPVTETDSSVQEQDPINTVPIGLGIAASGIAGSVGAVIADSMMPSEQKDVIPDYEEPTEIVEKVEKSKEELDESIAREEKFDDVSPYHAERNKEVIDKFYAEKDNN
ncbi:MAG: hypothetical protein IJG97_02385 [Bacilli bacterium]|nr:hypothetical protein [Bacilli bacterium]